MEVRDCFDTFLAVDVTAAHAKLSSDVFPLLALTYCCAILYCEIRAVEHL